MSAQQPGGQGSLPIPAVAFFMPAVEAYIALDAPHNVELVFYNLPAEGVQTQQGQRVVVTMSPVGADVLCRKLQGGIKKVLSQATKRGRG